MSEAAVRSPSAPKWRRYLPRILIVTALYFALLVYPVVRLIGLVAPDVRLGTPALLAIIVLPILGRMLYERAPSAFTRMTSAFSLTWLGICFQLFPLMIVFEIANIVVDIPGPLAGWTLIGIAAALSVIGFVNAQLLHVRSVPLAGSASVRGKTLVQVSDVHIGSRSPRLLRRIVDRVNAVRPDYVVITGDLIDFSGITRDQLSALGAFDAPCYFAIGNHERYVDLTAICERLRSLGVNVLRNEGAVAGPFQFIGVDDVDKPTTVAKTIETIGVSRDHYTVLLYHRPDGFEASAQHRIDLTLAGHTHAGQIIPFNLIVRKVYPQLRGIYRAGESTMYVSPGTGTWGPILRIGSRSEITRFVFE
jgi:predicted MPP superfamily phosphohydrolase